MNQDRYCTQCQEWTSANPCPECGAITTLAATERERDDDDSVTYSDPRDARDERRHR